MSNNIPPINKDTDQSLKVLTDTYIDLLSVLEPKFQEENKYDQKTLDLLYDACSRICKSLSISLNPLPSGYFTSAVFTSKYLDELSYYNAFRYRLESLQPLWWQKDCGPLLAFRKKDKQPLALIRKKNVYFYYDSISQTEAPVTAQFSETLDTQVFFFYPSLPEKPLSWKDLYLFVFKNVFPDLKMLLVLQFIMGGLALLIPIFTKIFFESVIPNADTSHLKQLSFLLFVCIASTTLFGLAQTIHSLRMRYKSNITLEAAVWDRILKLPVNFLKQYTAGDLAQRAVGIDRIQQRISTAVITTALGSIFSILSLLLMFYFDIWLALYAFAFAILVAIISISLTFFLLKYQRQLLELQGKLAGLVFQLLAGVNKIRIANRELQAFKLWAHKFTEKNKVFFKVGVIDIAFNTFFPLLSVIATAILFAFVIQRGIALSFGDFMGFSAAFSQFFASFLAITSVITSAFETVPLYERVKPILHALPEKEENQIFLTEFNGAIAVENLSFRYEQDTPFILDNISFSINPGDFIAIVGPTGSGKSTLFRLLMGFETPVKGHLFFDNRDINTLNLRALRQYFGVMLQNSTLLPGSIFENLAVLNPDLTQEEALHACALMQIADEIQQMPMGLHTLLSEGGRNISVGQRQRIMLARSIIHKPKCLFLDEATSALDNITQAKIHENLMQLNITRVVIAHRISAIKKADVIYVIDQGIIKESGTYTELMAKNGLFTSLAQKQSLI